MVIALYLCDLGIFLQLTLIEGYIGETGSCVNRVVSVGITVSPSNWHLTALFQ